MSTLVLGIGNTLLSDEGIGVHVLRALEASPDRHLELKLLDGGTLSFLLLEDIAETNRIIVIDAARLGKEPGTITCVEGEALDDFLRGSRMSVHEVSLCDLLDMARLRGDLPGHRALIAIEPEVLTWGTRPSRAVESAIHRAAATVLELAERWEREERDATGGTID